MRTKSTAMSLLILFIFSLINFPVNAQLTKLWENHYVSRSDSNWVYSLNTNINGDKLQFDATGNCYFLSQVIPPRVDNTNPALHSIMQVTKYSPSVKTMWIQKDSGMFYNSCDNCGLYPTPAQMIVRSNGSFNLLASESYNTSIPTYYLNSSISSGAINWKNSVFYYLYNPFIAEDIYGNLGAASYSDVINVAGPTTLNISKITSTGSTLWVKNHQAPGGNSSTNNVLATDAAGNFYTMSGSYDQYSQSSFKTKIWLTKYDSSGIVAWEKNIDSGNVPPQAVDLLYNSVDNNLYVSYAITNNINLVTTISLTKFSTNGIAQWTKTNENRGGENKIKQDKQGNVYLWYGEQKYGFTYSGGLNTEGILVKYNSAGNELARMSGGSFALDALGYIYTNHATLINGYYYHAYKKYSSNGILLFDVAKGKSPSSNTFEEVYCDPTNNLYTLTEDYAPDTLRVVKYNTKCTATAAPITPPAITGSKTFYCGYTSQSYSCKKINNATYYNWSVPADVIIDSGQGTSTIYLHHSTAFRTGTISVYAANCFGASAPVSIAVTDTLKKPGGIAGQTSVCKGATSVQYSIAAIDGASYYKWEIPAGASFSQGYGNGETGLPEVKINFGNNGGNISVFAINICDSSLKKTLKVSTTSCLNLNSLAKVFQQQILIYPNPSNSIFILQFPGSNVANVKIGIDIKDVAGRKIEHLEATGNSVTFGKELTAGIYFVEVFYNDKKETIKIIKQ